MPPSLHAGLIERARPRTVVPFARSSANPATEPVTRRVTGPDLSRPLAALDAVKPPSEPVATVRPRSNAVRTAGRRCGLTVRVAPETRQELEILRDKTGQTFQQILHRALLDLIGPGHGC